MAATVQLQDLKGEEGATVRGWNMRIDRGPILTSSETDTWGKDLRLETMPEMVFGQNALTLTHLASGVTVNLNARDALAAVTRVGAAGQSVEIEAARAWKERFARETAEEGAAGARAASNGGRASAGSEGPTAADAEGDKRPFKVVKIEYDYDWTFATEYAGTLTVNGAAADASAGSPIGVPVASEDTRIDLRALMRHDPITHYGEVDLFEDELHDHGLCGLSAKIRVMPERFFCLMRFWVRVDGVNIRVRDTRFYHEFGSSCIVRETKWTEDSIEELQKRNPRLEIYRANDPAAFANTMTVVKEVNEVIPLA